MLLFPNNFSCYKLDPPTSFPMILANPANFEYDDGTRVNLTCELSGGNPLATLSFKCNEISGTQSNYRNETAISVLSVIVDKTYNNKQCSCLAMHRLFNISRPVTKTLNIFCKYLGNGC